MRHLKLFFCVAAVAMALSCNQNTKTTSEGGSSAPVAGSIVYIQLDSVINNYDMFNDLKSEFEAKVQKIQSELQSKGRDFQNAAKDFENKINKGLLTQAEAQERNRVLTNRQNDLQNLSAQREAEIAEEQSVMINKVMDAVQTYVEKYNKEKKYAMILTSTAVNTNVLSADPALDITKEITEGLNNEYVKNKKSSNSSETKSEESKSEAEK
ncbi:MAG: OmpH family outer membrane protein [Bacteroidales bacterium]|nr:OmpH family outer membrane protein [Bacteroidales bacterium]